MAVLWSRPSDVGAAFSVNVDLSRSRNAKTAFSGAKAPKCTLVAYPLQARGGLSLLIIQCTLRGNSASGKDAKAPLSLTSP